MTDKQVKMIDINKAIEIMKEMYPDAMCALHYKTPVQLLVAVQLSAQCTDARVNLITPALFEKYPDAFAFAEADMGDLEEMIRSCGFYHAKSKNIIGCCKILADKFNGEVPSTMEELVALPGVGRKTANLVLGDVFGQPSYVVDTHCIRISNRMGLTEEEDPVKIERDLRRILPPEESGNFCHRIVLLGREYCPARKPKCEICPLNGICPKKL